MAKKRLPSIELPPITIEPSYKVKGKVNLPADTECQVGDDRFVIPFSKYLQVVTITVTRGVFEETDGDCLVGDGQIQWKAKRVELGPIEYGLFELFWDRPAAAFTCSSVMAKLNFKTGDSLKTSTSRINRAIRELNNTVKVSERHRLTEARLKKPYAHTHFPIRRIRVSLKKNRVWAEREAQPLRVVRPDRRTSVHTSRNDLPAPCRSGLCPWPCRYAPGHDRSKDPRHRAAR